MLAIRMQRVGRKGHAQFRVIAQDDRFHPSSGRVVAYLGNYDPHSKAAQIDKDKILEYITKGAQPSPRVVKLLKKESVKLPDWVKVPEEKKKSVRNPEKRRSTAPKDAQPKAEAPAKEPAAAEAEQPAEEKPAENAGAEEQPTEEAKDEAPGSEADTPKDEPKPEDVAKPDEPAAEPASEDK
jgi:small subunit ribosomal protein S16